AQASPPGRGACASADPARSARSAASTRPASGPCATGGPRQPGCRIRGHGGAPDQPRGRSPAPRPAALPEPPVDVVLALGGERLVDSVLVDLERLHRFLVL